MEYLKCSTLGVQNVTFNDLMEAEESRRTTSNGNVFVFRVLENIYIKSQSGRTKIGLADQRVGVHAYNTRA